MVDLSHSVLAGKKGNKKWERLPSSKHTKNYGKWSIYEWLVIFHFAMLNYQRVHGFYLGFVLDLLGRKTTPINIYFFIRKSLIGVALNPIIIMIFWYITVNHQKFGIIIIIIYPVLVSHDDPGPGSHRVIGLGFIYRWESSIPWYIRIPMAWDDQHGMLPIFHARNAQKHRFLEVTWLVDVSSPNSSDDRSRVCFFFSVAFGGWNLKERGEMGVSSQVGRTYNVKTGQHEQRSMKLQVNLTISYWSICSDMLSRYSACFQPLYSNSKLKLNLGGLNWWLNSHVKIVSQMDPRTTVVNCHKPSHSPSHSTSQLGVYSIL